MTITQVRKAVAASVKSGAVVTIVRKKDQREFTGTLFSLEDGNTYAVRSGKPGRPVTITVEDIAELNLASA